MYYIIFADRQLSENIGHWRVRVFVWTHTANDGAIDAATAKRPFSHLWRWRFLIPAAQKVSFQLPIVSANKPVCRRSHKAKHTPVSQNTKDAPRWNFSPDFHMREKVPGNKKMPGADSQPRLCKHRYYVVLLVIHSGAAHFNQSKISPLELTAVHQQHVGSVRPGAV